jgi:hypothetical protein
MDSPDKAATLTAKLMRFYTPEIFRLMRDVIEHRTGRISLRLLDWLVTSYAKRRNSSFLLGDARVVIFTEYKAMLKSYSKCNFDPFCRRSRIFVDTEARACVHGPAGGTVIQTTNGQLNFFKWAVSRGIVIYAGTHIAEIEEDLAVYSNRPRNLISLPKHGYTSIDDTVVVSFD